MPVQLSPFASFRIGVVPSVRFQLPISSVRDSAAMFGSRSQLSLRRVHFSVAAFVTTCLYNFSAAQEVILSDSNIVMQSGSTKSQPSIRIDLSKLPPDVLNCNVCRMRLGLAPIPGGGTLDAAEHDAKAAAPAQSLPAPSKSVVEAEPVEVQSLPSTSNADNMGSKVQESLSPSDVQPNIANTGDVSNKLSQFASPQEARREASANDSAITNSLLQDNSRFSSQSAIQIELELAKKQLLERNQLIEEFSQNQSRLETQINELSLMNRQYETNLKQQNEAAEKLNSQLREQADSATSKLSALQQELEQTKRELSVAIANQKLVEKSQESQGKAQLTQLQQQLEIAQREATNSREQVETLRRQRDGFERELASLSEKLQKSSSASSSTASVTNTPDAQAKINALQLAYDELEEKHNNMIATARANGAKKKDEVASLNARIAALQSRLQNQSVELAPESAASLPSDSELGKENRNLAKLIEVLQQEKAALKEELSRLRPQPSAAQEVPFTEAQKIEEATPTDNTPLEQSVAPGVDTPSSDATATEEAESDATADEDATPFKVGPKKPSRAPRKPAPPTNERREI